MRVFSTLMFLWSNENKGKQRSKNCNQNLTQLIVDESYCRMESLKTAQPRSVHPLSWLSGTNFPHWELIILHTRLQVCKMHAVEGHFVYKMLHA